MRKKIIGIFTVLCLIFPCFFAVACSKSTSDPNFEPYTFSVTLKNAAGKIEEAALPTEYDHEKGEVVNWTKEGNDYKISVTRSSQVSGNLVVNLLEGYDFSDLRFKVNGEQKDYVIKSGEQTDCANKAYLTDRQLVYAYEKNKDDIVFEIDFASCELAKVNLDISSLKNYNVRYCVVEDDFVTMIEGENIVSRDFKEIDKDTITVDYGTILAFDYSEKIAFTDSFERLKNLSYASYGLRFLMSMNRIQYLSASIDGKCDIYSPTLDSSKNGTLRVLGNASGLSYSNTLLGLQNYLHGSSNQEFEYYDGEMLAMTIFTGAEVYIELSQDAQRYNYYLVDKLDEKWLGAITQKTIEGTDRKYIEINLTNANGTPSQTKYLVRKARSQSNFYMVYAEEMVESTRFTNADYILVGDENMPSGISSVNEKVFYCFETTKDVRVTLPAITIDPKTNIGKLNSEISITASNVNSYGRAELVTATKDVNPSVVANVSIPCYDSTANTKFYHMNFNYKPTSFNEHYFDVSSNELHLYDGEDIYYTNDPTDAESWIKFEKGTNLQLYSGEGATIFYYFNSNRQDANLNIENNKNENISTGGILRDCFGRLMVGTVNIDGAKIDLSKVKYIDITPGYYNYAIAKIVRAYDVTYHKVNIDQVINKSVKISMDNYLVESDFKSLSDLSGLEIRCTGYELLGEIYYYVDYPINYRVVLKDNNGEIVSTSHLAHQNDNPVVINGKNVYCLSLNGGYYSAGEVFTAELMEDYYTIADESGTILSLYTSDDGDEDLRESHIYERRSYFVTCEDDYRLDICDEFGNVVVDWEDFTQIDAEIGGVMVYLFTFKISGDIVYAPETVFTLVKSLR